MRELHAQGPVAEGHPRRDAGEGHRINHEGVAGILRDRQAA
jgi:hypothetical protein